MRSRSYSKNRNRSIEVGRSKLKEEPQLCGAFIRSLVRQLSSSRTKEPMNSSSSDGKVGDKSFQNLTKKQVRRRFHTSRPYQERLLNMAEARREIVAALKFHRATMRKASEQQQQQQQQQHSALEQEVLSSTIPTPIERSCLGKKYRTNTSTITTFDHFDNTSFLSASHPPDFSWFSNSLSPVSISENFNLVPPKPPLGLNLNFDGFENLETTFRCSTNSSLSVSFSSPSTTVTSSSSSYPCSSCTTLSVAEAPLVRPTAVSEATSEPRVESLHPVMDDKEMEEIRSIGEQHNMEWNDKLNSVRLAWWCEFLKTVETDFHGEEERIYGREVDGVGLVDEAIGIPPWLSDQQHLDDYSTDAGCLEDATLPRLVTGENEGNDPEWLL